MPKDWTKTNLSGPPRLLLGRRKSSKKIDVHRVEVHENVFEDFRDIAKYTIIELKRRDPKPYSAFAGKDPDDYFDIDTDDIPRRKDRRKREDDPEAWEIASTLAMVADCDQHPTLTAEELRQAASSLYAIVFEHGGEYVGFIKCVSPKRAIKPGWKYLQYGDTLRKVEPPDLMIYEDIDVVVAADRCAVLSSAAFATLFGDVGIAFKQVPANVETIARILRGVLPIGEETIVALQDRCERRISDAKRLQHIVSEREGALKRLKRKELESLIQKRGLGNVVKSGQLLLTTEKVSDFLDLIEGRLFSDDVTREERRADSYSPRKLSRL